MNKMRMIASAAVLALLSGSAMAVGPDGTTNVIWNLKADTGVFCVLNTASVDTTSSSSATFDSVDGTGGNINISLVGTGNTVGSWTADIKFGGSAAGVNNSACNSSNGYSVTAKSANGGLKAATASTDASYATLVPYTVNLTLGSDVGVQRTSTELAGAGAVALSGTKAVVGQFEMKLVGFSDTKKVLLPGNYTDTLALILTANGI